MRRALIIGSIWYGWYCILSIICWYKMFTELRTQKFVYLTFCFSMKQFIYVIILDILIMGQRDICSRCLFYIVNNQKKSKYWNYCNTNMLRYWIMNILQSKYYSVYSKTETRCTVWWVLFTCRISTGFAHGLTTVYYILLV